MKRGKLFEITVGCLFFVLVLSVPSFAANVVKIGVYQPLSGHGSFAGKMELDGIRLAHALRPQVLGRPVSLAEADIRSDRREAAAAVKRLIRDDGAVAVIGSYGSAAAIAGGAVAEQEKIPMIGTSCTNPRVTQGRKYCFRACFTDAYQGAAAASYAFSRLGFRKAAILSGAGEYSSGLADCFRAGFRKMGGSIVAEASQALDELDFSEQIRLLSKVNPDVVFLPAYFSEGMAFVHQARAAGAKYAIMGGDAMDNPDIVSMGADAEGLFHTTFPYDANMPMMNAEAEAFTRAWKQAFPGRKPNVNAVLGFTCYNLLLDAMERSGGTDAEKLVCALESTGKYPTPLGSLTINAAHDGEMPVGIIRCVEGKREYVGSIHP
ncbi:MAG: ABC transporter substrate-binding protein [Desulfovibrionaceae bacterium]|nr:ABC transporter substrate-binding protein [Desulfovibrionaceae bacterium]